MITVSANGGDAAPAPDGLGGQVRTSIGGLYRRFRSERTPGDLGDTAFEVLSVLQKDGPQSLTELSERARVATASMSQSVNRLTAGGYAVRTPDPKRSAIFWI